MHKKALFPIFLLLLLMAAFSTVRADGLDDFIAGQIKIRKIPGLSVAVLYDGKVVRSRGYGKISWIIFED